MTFTRTAIPDVVIIEPKVHGDSRGYFVETFRQDKLEEFLGYQINFCQVECQYYLDFSSLLYFHIKEIRDNGHLVRVRF